MKTWKSSCLFASLAILLCATAALAQDRGTPEQQAACAPDAFRLCASSIPDPDRTENCLRQQKVRLSSACRALFDQHTGAADVARETKAGGARASVTRF
jgi:hypothetical protein